MSSGSSTARSLTPDVYQKGTVPIEWTQFPAPSSFSPTYAVATGSDGNVWFGNNNGGLLRVSMTGAMKLVPLPYDCGESSPCAFIPGTGMAVGSDGKFYLGGANINAARTLETIGVVTTAGKLTLYDLPSGDVIANDALVLGPDKKVWFGERTHIGNIDVNGKVTEYAYPSSAPALSGTMGMTSGPAGSVWFASTDESGSVVGKVSPNGGKITLYPQTGVTVGVAMTTANGALYSIEGFANALVAISTAGAGQSAGADGFGISDTADGLIAGPDGHPWFASGKSSIAEYNPANDSFTNYIPPYANQEVHSLALGPDGNIWAPALSPTTINVYILKTLVVTPKSVKLSAPGNTSTLTVSEPATTAWSASSTSPGICSVAQGTPSDTFTVTAAGKGTSTITIEDAIGNSVEVKCTVS